MAKNLPAVWETWVRSLGGEDSGKGYLVAHMPSLPGFVSLNAMVHFIEGREEKPDSWYLRPPISANTAGELVALALRQGAGHRVCMLLCAGYFSLRQEVSCHKMLRDLFLAWKTLQHHSICGFRINDSGVAWRSSGQDSALSRSSA